MSTGFLLFSLAYFRTTSHFDLFIVCIFVPYFFSLVTVRLWSKFQQVPHFEGQCLLEGRASDLIVNNAEVNRGLRVLEKIR